MPVVAATVPRTEPRSHSVFREGIIAGAIGATGVAVWFLLIDVLAGHPFRTPELLGRGLLSVLGPRGSEGAITYVASYTVFHYAAFAAIGVLATQIVHWAEQMPSILAGVLILFVAVEIGFYGFVAMLSEPGALGSIAWYQVLLGNLIAAASMGWYLWRTHPGVGARFDDALSGRE